MLFGSATFVGVQVVVVAAAAEVESLIVKDVVVPLLKAKAAGKIILTNPAPFAIAPLALV